MEKEPPAIESSAKVALEDTLAPASPNGSQIVAENKDISIQGPSPEYSASKEKDVAVSEEPVDQRGDVPEAGIVYLKGSRLWLVTAGYVGSTEFPFSYARYAARLCMLIVG